MTERNGHGPHKTAPEVPVGKPFSPGHDPRRNGGGRPRGLASLVRQAVADGESLVRFYVAVFAGDAGAIGERRRISLRDRMLAGEWLAARGWGRAPVVVELPDEPAVRIAPELAAELPAMPDDLKRQMREWLESRREAYLQRERDAAERRMLAFMPPIEPDGNGDN